MLWPAAWPRFQSESQGQEGSAGRFACRSALAKQAADVLTGGNQVSLYPLTPEPPPAGSLNPVTVGGIGETAFHEIAPTFTVGPRRSAGRLGSQGIQFALPIQTLHSAAVFGVSALWAQRALGANVCRGLVLPAALVGPVLPFRQTLSGGTVIMIVPLAACSLCRVQIGHVSD